MADNPEEQPVELEVTETEAGLRLDAFLASKFLTYSRVLLRKAIVAQTVSVDGKRAKPAYRLNVGQKITVLLPEIPHEGPQPENIPLDIIHEDDDLIVVNKSPGMVVHPAKGHWSGTLASALQYHFNQLSSVAGPSRPGIVHRLDRDTSGVLLVAKNDLAHIHLAKQFEHRTTKKEYFAIISGHVELDRDVISLPIGKHPHHREKMIAKEGAPDAKQSETLYEVQQRFGNYATLSIYPKTGRTHQIRVHLISIKCPVVCDRLYGSQSKLTAGELSGDLSDERVLLARQALHAKKLQITHPRSNKTMEFEAPLPKDLQQTITFLEQRSK